jgi:uncharacterized protein DUF5335
MPTQAIPRDEWVFFFNSFGLRHQGWLVTIEVLGSEIGAQVKAEEMPLDGITAELNRSGEDVISILVGGTTPQERVTHIIYAPTHVRVKQTEAGADEALEIESAGSTTVLRFRSAVLPEMVDGIL